MPICKIKLVNLLYRRLHIMKRILLKIILIILTFFIIGGIFSLMRISGFGSLPLAIVAIGMFAGIRAIWKYNPTSNEIDLKKDE